jgi:hypothetical protein
LTIGAKSTRGLISRKFATIGERTNLARASNRPARALLTNETRRSHSTRDYAGGAEGQTASDSTAACERVISPQYYDCSDN